MTTSYNYVFGGANIYPSEVSYESLTLTADIQLSWPEETSALSNLAAKIIDIQSSIAGLKVLLPDAQKAGTGETILFNNLGTETIIIADYDGVQVVSIDTGTLWQVYLTDNSTSAGTWQSLQYGSATSQANASALAGTGIVAVGTALSQSVPVTTFSANFTLGNTDRAKMYNWTGAGGVLTLPSAETVGNNWFMYLRNSGSGAIVATPAGTNTINDLTDLSFQPGESAIIASDGRNFYTIGFGQSATFAFDYTSINAAGSGTLTLSGTQLNRIAYNFTGVLTGNRIVIVPTTVQQYWITNSTTGSYTFTVKTATGAGVTITQGQRGIYYCNGTDLLIADTASISLPIDIGQGGTGASTSSGALINLGGGSTGIAIFSSVTQTDVWNQLGNAQNVNGGAF
jgi:hypothetical protein